MINALVRAVALQVLAELARLKAQPRGGSAVIRLDGWTVGVFVGPEDPETPTRIPADLSDGLSEVERNALAAATERPQTVKQLARKAGYRPGSHFSGAVTSLTRRGLLVRTPDGVKRT